MEEFHNSLLTFPLSFFLPSLCLSLYLPSSLFMSLSVYPSIYLSVYRGDTEVNTPEEKSHLWQLQTLVLCEQVVWYSPVCLFSYFIKFINRLTLCSFLCLPLLSIKHAIIVFPTVATFCVLPS